MYPCIKQQQLSYTESKQITYADIHRQLFWVRLGQKIQEFYRRNGIEKKHIAWALVVIGIGWFIISVLFSLN